MVKNKKSNMKTKDFIDNFNQNPLHNKEKYEHVNHLEEIEQYKDVDSIIGELIPDYKEEVSIELNNVNLTFNMEIDKVDNLKESFIRTLKRDKSKKIKLHTLKNISFRINKGEKIGIIGYNGAGKSTH